MMLQSDKVEKFKYSRRPEDSLHAKYNALNFSTVVGDGEWGHLQLDAIGLFLLFLSQMTASGLSIVYTLDEVAFIQNLVFYIETAYRTPDYGIWERGDKTNHGLTELNASSIGMCLAALEAIDGLDLFQSKGGFNSIIHVSPDEKARCQDILESLLPRESRSKEVGAALLPIISFPAFAVTDSKVFADTYDKIMDRLQGKYGFVRFLRDGYQTPLEDKNRLHYEPAELEQFDTIECQWPLFHCFHLIERVFYLHSTAEKDDEVVQQEIAAIRSTLDNLLVKDENIIRGKKLMPCLYSISADQVSKEKEEPNSADRRAVGPIPHLWGQSLYILSRLLIENCIQPSELDPLNRRLAMQRASQVQIQITVVAQNEMVKEKLKDIGFNIQTEADIENILLRPSAQLAEAKKNTGQSEKLGLTGRPKIRAGILSTSKVYELSQPRHRLVVFYPEFASLDDFWIISDVKMFIDRIKTELCYLQSHWRLPGRPIVVIPLHSEYIFDNGKVYPAIQNMMKRFASGYAYGARVVLGHLNELLATSLVTKATFKMDDQSSVMSPTKRVSKYLRTFPQKTRQRKLYASPKLDLTDRTLVAVEPRLSRVRSISENLENGGRCRQEDIDSLLQASTLSKQAQILIGIYLTTNDDYRLDIPGYGAVKITILLEELYHRAIAEQNWLLVREIGGFRNKQLACLDQAVTDILVHQKSITVGFVNDSTESVIDRPLMANELIDELNDSCTEPIVAILHQEIIFYLGMLIRSSPSLFRDLLRLRVGLIIQVVASEMSRLFNYPGVEATAALLALPPSEIKNLIDSLLSGNEIAIKAGDGFRQRSHTAGNRRGSLAGSSLVEYESLHSLSRTLSRAKSKNSDMIASSLLLTVNGSQPPVEIVFEAPGERAGTWLRRRQLDGALNRMPQNFYSQVWQVLDRCHGIQVGAHLIPSSVTREMTPYELKFALLVENTLNNLPEPEMRQIAVEALSMLSLLTTVDIQQFEWLVDVDRIIRRAEELFLADQLEENGECEKADFLDSAPSGRYGTMTYLVRSSSEMIHNELNTTLPQSCIIG